MLKYLNFFLIIVSLCSFQAKSQEIQVNENLKLIRLTDKVYMHTSNGNNGIIYFNRGECILVSTPASDEITYDLIKWVRESLKVEIKACIIDRWHPDAMGGLGAVKKSGIASYAYEKTRKIAEFKHLPVPDEGFDPLLELNVGKEKVICHFLGEAHTNDGIIVWIPSEMVLFGGNEIRNFNGMVGNIADANIKEWSNTIRKVKELYGTAKIVVPGHGNFGGPELIDYTIQLYEPSEWGTILRYFDVERKAVFNAFEDIFEVADHDSVSGDSRFLSQARIFVKDEKRIVVIDARNIEHQVDRNIVSAPDGRLRVYNDSSEGLRLLTDVYFENLTVMVTSDEVGMVIILRKML